MRISDWSSDVCSSDLIATAEAAAVLGAKPVYVDIDPITYNLNPALIEAAITPRTRAIVAVSLYGQCADFDAINAIADRYGITVLEDRSEEHTYELQSLMRISYAVFCLKKKKRT